MTYVGMRGAGGPEVLTISQGPRPQAGPGEVLIKVAAAGVNRPDLAQRKGVYPPPPGASPILGLEVAGHIFEAPADSPWRVGDAVCALAPGGGYAEYCVVPARHCLRIPDGLSLIEAAAIPETFFTVWANVFQLARLQPGERLLVHGGTSGIGTTAIQLAKAFGSEVYATAGSDRKCAACLELGATAAINYRDEDFVARLAELTAGAGVHVVLDMVGGDYTQKNIDALAAGGRIVQIATLGGAKVLINLVSLMQKRALITGSTLRPRSVADKALLADELRARVWPLLAAGRVKVVVDRVFALADVQQAHAYLEAGEHIGKVVLAVEA